jgi:hypothetical protein
MFALCAETRLGKLTAGFCFIFVCMYRGVNSLFSHLL